MKRGRRLSGCARSSGRVTESGLGGLAVHGIIPTVVATLNMKGAIQWWAATSAMVGLSEGSVASKQDNNCRKPGENWAGNGEVTPETNVFFNINERPGTSDYFHYQSREGGSLEGSFASAEFVENASKRPNVGPGWFSLLEKTWVFFYRRKPPRWLPLKRV